MVFQNTPGNEAPAEMNTWFPQFKAFWAAENITGTIHNIYTLRGALVRDALYWSKQINEALPLRRRGRGDVRIAQLAAMGQRAHPGGDAGAARRMPTSTTGCCTWPARASPSTRSTTSTGSRKPATAVGGAQLSRLGGAQQPRRDQPLPGLLGWQPRHADPAVPSRNRAAVRLDDGRRREILAKAGELHSHGEDLQAMEFLNKLVYAEPDNIAARQLLADVFEQIGYQKESSSLRNAFLAAALDLRLHAFRAGARSRRGHPALVDRRAAARSGGDPARQRTGRGQRFTLNLVIPDVGEKFVVELSNATLTHIKGMQAGSPTRR